MSPLLFCKMRRVGCGLALGLLLVGGACRPYRMPSPQGPAQPKVKAGNKDEVSADGRSTSATTDIKPVHNTYDKKGLLKKPKYERRRLKKKVGQRKFLGIPLPF